jgi:hypothetical protein
MQATPVGTGSLKVRISVAAPSPTFPATSTAAAGAQNVRTDLALSPDRMEVDSHRRNQFSDIYGDDDVVQPQDDDGNSTDTAGREIEAVSDDQAAPAEKEKGVEKGGDEEESPPKSKSKPKGKSKTPQSKKTKTKKSGEALAATNAPEESSSSGSSVSSMFTPPQTPVISKSTATLTTTSTPATTETAGKKKSGRKSQKAQAAKTSSSTSVTGAGPSSLESAAKTNRGKRVNKLIWNKMNEVLQGDQFQGLCALSLPPPLDELRRNAAILAQKVGRERIARTRRVHVRIAVDQAAAVFSAIAPSMKRKLDGREANEMKALWKFLFENNSEHRTRYSSESVSYDQ